MPGKLKGVANIDQLVDCKTPEDVLKAALLNVLAATKGQISSKAATAVATSVRAALEALRIVDHERRIKALETDAGADL